VSTGRRSSRAPRHCEHAPVSSSQATTHLSLPLSLLRDGRKYDLPSSYVVSTWPLVLSLILTHGLVVLRPGHTAAVLDPARWRRRQRRLPPSFAVARPRPDRLAVVVSCSGHANLALATQLVSRRLRYRRCSVDQGERARGPGLGSAAPLARPHHLGRRLPALAVALWRPSDDAIDATPLHSYAESCPFATLLALAPYAHSAVDAALKHLHRPGSRLPFAALVRRRPSARDQITCLPLSHRSLDRRRASGSCARRTLDRRGRRPTRAHQALKGASAARGAAVQLSLTDVLLLLHSFR
jgi:hypothetical protein